ncbi:MAG TPA: hypothetical protein VK427_10270, partial [Kofleriaceae bacterium]|nr:hypothetical protein [Kofleriaceae bacterium]
MSALLELGERYWALGLPAAARSALTRALAETSDAAPALRLADIALAQGDAQGALKFAAEAAKRAPGPSTRILLGRAQLAAGELAAARMSLLVAIDSPKLAAWERPRVHLELARVAQGQNDAAGAAAHANAGFDAMLAAAKAPGPVDLALIEELSAAVVAHGRTDDATASIEAAKHQPNAPLCAASLLVARQAAGDTTVSDRHIDEALEVVTPTAHGSVSGVAVRLRRLERRVRKHAGDAGTLLVELDELLSIATGEALPAVDRARLWFLYGAVCADDPGRQERAEDAYRKGLAFQPGHTGAACRLALLVLDRGDQAGALAEIERALRIDASHGLAWRNAARMLDAQSPSLGVIVGRLLDAANPGAGSVAAGVAPRLVTATAEVARHDVLAGVYAHGHRVKNLLGIIGARARSARKAAGDGDLHERLKDLETDVTALYQEWAQYLRSMQ